MAEQYKAWVPMEKRVEGWLYDYSSGVCMGIASDEQRKKYPPEKQPFDINIAGCPHKLVIHQSRQPIIFKAERLKECVTDPSAIFEWTYSRSKGDIEVYAPNEREAARLVQETGMVKNYDPKKLKKTNGTLSDRLKKEGIK